MRPADLSAVILAGGKSRRMGCDKAWMESNGQPLIVRARNTLRGAGVKEILISGRAGTDYSTLACPVLLDLEPDLGPLSGVERALHAATSPLVLVLAVDLPEMTTSCLCDLARQCDPLTGVIPKVNRALEPLAAIYPKRCHVFLVEFQARGCHTVRDFARACLRERAARIYRVPPAHSGYFANWNRPEDVPQPSLAV